MRQTQTCIARAAALLLALCASSLCAPHIVISEILRNPAGNSSACPGDKCHEFIELTNLGTDTLALDSLFITSGTTVDSVEAWSTPIAQHSNCRYGQTTLGPGKSAVILDREYAAAPTFSFADSTLLLTVNHVSLLGGLTDTRGILLYKGSRAAIVDSLAAAIDAGLNAQTETLVLTEPPNTPDGYSLVPSRVLSYPLAYEPNLDSLDPGTFSPVQNGWIIEYSLAPGVLSADAVACSAAILRVGANVETGVQWRIVNKTGGTIAGSGIVGASPRPFLFAASIPKDSAAYEISVRSQSGQTLAALAIDLSQVWLPANPLRINEIFPRATSSIPEWIEITNVSAMPINLKHWRLGMPDGCDTITLSDLLLEPSSFCVVTRDRALFSAAFPAISMVVEPAHWQALDNYRDTLLLYNPLDSAPCETVYYTSSWFDSWDNQSLERVSLTASGTARSGWALAAYPSPGQPNAGASWRAVQSPSMHIGPVPFTPNGDGTDDLLLVELKLPADASARIDIYGFSGEVLYEAPRPVGARQFWNGTDNHGHDAPVGPFFVVAEIERGGRKERIRKKGVLWR